MNADLIPLSKGWVRREVDPPPEVAWVDSLRWAEAAVAKVARPEIPAGAPVEAIPQLAGKVLSWRDLREVRFPPPDWLIKGFLERHKFAAIISQAKAAKSWMALTIGISVATGLPPFQYPDMDSGTRPSKVFVVCVEDHAPDVQRRVRSLWAGMDVMPHDDENLGNNLHFLAGQRIDLMTREQFLQLIATIRHTVVNPDLVILDPFVDLVQIDNENDARQMAQAVERFRIIRDVFNCAVLLVHHAKKKASGGEEQDVNAARGSNAFMGKLDSWAVLDKVEAAEDGSSVASDFRVTLKNGRRVPHLRMELKIEDSAEGYAKRAHWVIKRKIKVEQESQEALEERVIAHIAKAGITGADALAQHLGDRNKVRAAVKALKDSGRLVYVNRKNTQGYALPDAQFP